MLSDADLTALVITAKLALVTTGILLSVGTPLAWAVLHGKREVAARLLEAGADANALSRGKNTPLHTAAVLGRDRCARLLLDAGAKADARNDRGQSPKDLLSLDRTTTEFLARLLRVEIDFDTVTRGREAVATLFGGGDGKKD